MATEAPLVLIFDFHKTLVSVHFGGPISTDRSQRFSGGTITKLGGDEDRRYDFFDFELMTEIFRRGPGVGVICAIATNLGNRWDCYSPQDMARMKLGREIQPDCDAWISGRRAVNEWLKLLYGSEHAMRDLLPEELVQAISPTANTPDEEYNIALRQLSVVADMTEEAAKREAIARSGKNPHIDNIVRFLRGTRHPVADEIIGLVSLETQVVFLDDRPLNTEMAERHGVLNSVAVSPQSGVSARTWPDLVAKSSALRQIHDRLWPNKEPADLQDLLHPRPVGSMDRAGSPSPPGSPRGAPGADAALCCQVAAAAKAGRPATLVGATLFGNEVCADKPCVVCGMESTHSCGKCKKSAYCCAGCQKVHWNSGHSQSCSDA